MQPAAEESQNPVRWPQGQRRWAILHLVLWGGLWLVPLVVCELRNRVPNFLPAEVRTYYRLAALFTKRTSAWTDEYVLGRVVGSAEWVELDVGVFDPVKVYGIESRLERVLGISDGKGRAGEAVREQVAAFVARRHALASGKRLEEVRFVAVRWPVGSSEWMKHPPGKWWSQPLAMIPKGQQRVLSTHRVAEATNNRPVPLGPVLPVQRPKDDAALAALMKRGRESVVELDLGAGQSAVTERGMAVLWGHEGLRRLSLAKRTVNPGMLPGLKTLTGLTELTLAGAGLPEGMASALVGMKHLRVLQLREARGVTREFIQGLKGLKTLQVLDVGGTGAGAAAMGALGAWPAMKECRLDGSVGLRAVMQTLKAHEKLEILSLAKTDVGSLDLWHLQRLRKLTSLYLDQTVLGPEAVAALEGLPNLRHLSLRGTKMSAEALRRVSTLPQLTHVRTGQEWKTVGKKSAAAEAKGGLK